MNNGNLPAAPGPIYSVDADGTQIFVCHGTGLTKREELAARAMQGMLSAGTLGQEGEIEDIPCDAVRFADALLAELEKDQ